MVTMSTTRGCRFTNSPATLGSFFLDEDHDGECREAESFPAIAGTGKHCECSTIKLPR